MPTNQFDFLNQHALPQVPTETPAMLLHKKEFQDLLQGLREAEASWSSRSYVQNSDWTEINERRRDYNLGRIRNLIQWAEEKGFLTPRQKDLARRLIKNAKH